MKTKSDCYERPRIAALLRLLRCLTMVAVLACAGQTGSNAATLPAGFSETAINGPSGSWSEVVGIHFEENGRMYVWQRTGRVWIKEDNTSTWNLLIDISEEVG